MVLVRPRKVGVPPVHVTMTSFTGSATPSGRMGRADEVIVHVSALANGEKPAEKASNRNTRLLGKSVMKTARPEFQSRSGLREG